MSLRGGAADEAIYPFTMEFASLRSQRHDKESFLDSLWMDKDYNVVQIYGDGIYKIHE